ncbi:hypothetical protein [Larkinella rosea]|uniref:Uncharacterized protein n=1 Tax=Larkinella rosea TaxID=2025312 RepID=A0A3P1C2L1_9BACT|nr:hypothetical protein [Larkinella rosea]RRB07489.1 hypothetical protein EHT25_06835 [Larkinella rosea]
MKSVVALLLVLQMLGSGLLPGFGIDQSTKLVDLLQHFQHHRQTEPDLGFFDFIAMHYGANSDHQKHPNHSHHNLPAVGHTAPAFTAPAMDLFSLTSISVWLPAKTACFRYANLYSFVSVSSLINPPRR